MSAYFVVSVEINEQSNQQDYDKYIDKVVPIVKKYGGEYLVRSNLITPLSDNWKPDRMIIIRFDNKQQIFDWLNSEEYKNIADYRINSVISNAVIIEQ
ncbi:DUF1330 domain-containing protein [Breznakia pachnodae]|uniref:Uncharacterized protein (DUF1330 family) n=1 Tax=Breznakia pachnodae TaxID=265178 RepID=A0ABU0E190_9FIRM|nr:DUF1330 domain-containing protein [Breznakia pachnodae]MDQ0360643.1 uncharacterized protein (DUF1330 family) [Breznakia pachnodae]